MPAITTDNILALPRIARPDPAVTKFRLQKVVTAPRQLEGAGFPVRRPFPTADFRDSDPFLLLDQLGEVEYAPGEAKGAPWHPHRGFETVTYVMDGAFEHHDSTGGGGLIANGSPRYQDIAADQVKLLSSDDGGALLRLIAGDLDGHAGPGVTWTPITYLHATVSPGSRLQLPWNPDFNALVYVLSGAGKAGLEGAAIREGQLAVFGSGDAISVEADRGQDSRAPNLEVLILGGKPIREPTVFYGPFVMNTREEILKAVEDYKAGRLGTIPASYLNK
jgi:redox-sensitive bicupin YhaK (pirin superfamily)